MNVGSSTYTDFNSGSVMIEMLEQYPQLDPVDPKADKAWRTGLIHTHHDMSAFFSSVDDDELNVNAHKFPFYLSLIVAYDGNFRAKIGLPMEEEVHTTTKYFVKVLNRMFEKPAEVKKRNVVQHIECEVVYERPVIQVPEWFKGRAEAINRPSRHSTGRSWEGSYLYGRGPYEQETAQEARETARANASKIPTIKDAPPEYLKILPFIGDLFALGLDSSQAPTHVFQNIGRLLSLQQVTEYKTAVISYFLEVWSQTHLTKNMDKEILFACVTRFITLQDEGWFKSTWMKTILPDFYVAVKKRTPQQEPV